MALEKAAQAHAQEAKAAKATEAKITKVLPGASKSNSASIPIAIPIPIPIPTAHAHPVVSNNSGDNSIDIHISLPKQLGALINNGAGGDAKTGMKKLSKVINNKLN